MNRRTAERTAERTVERAANLGLYLDQMFLNPVSDALNATTAVLTDPRTHRMIVRALILGTVAITAMVLALGGYASFWWVYVPQRGLRKEVLLQYGEGRPPYALLDLAPAGDFVASDQSYDVSLDLTVPSSARNMDLGNFMVRLTFLSAPPTNSTLHSVSRPASLVYQSPLTRSLLTFSNIRSLISYSSSQVQTITVPLMVERVLQSSGSRRSARIAGAIVEVGRRDAYPTSESFASTKGFGEPQIYDAMLRLDAHFQGLRWLMYHHPIFSFFFFTSSFLAAEMTVAVFVWALVAYNRGTTSPFERHHRPSSARLDPAPPSSSLISGPSSGTSTAREDEERLLRQRRRREREREEAARRRILEADQQVAEESRRRAEQVERSRASTRRMADVEPLEDEEEDDFGPREGAGSGFEEEAVEVKREPSVQTVKAEEEDDDDDDTELIGGSETTGTGTARSALDSRTTGTSASTSSTQQQQPPRPPSPSPRPTASREPSMRDVDDPSTAEGTEEER